MSTSVDERITALSYDLERTRGRTRRICSRQTSELYLALHALDSGKDHVVRDRIERAIVALEQLRNDIDRERGR